MSKGQVFVALAVTMLGLMASTAPASASALQAGSVYALRQSDYSPANPVVAIRGVWVGPPEGRALTGQAAYMVRLETTTHVEGIIPPVLDWGILDAEGLPEPTIYSYCGWCYDVDAGYPPPDPGWKEFGYHGPVQRRTDFQLSFDTDARRWVFFLDGVPLRSSSGGLAGPAARVSVGALSQGGAELVSHAHLDLQVRRAVTGWEAFEPRDSEWPQARFGDYVAWYQAPGSVRIGPLREPKASTANLSSVRQRGGGVPDLVAEAGNVFAAVGPSVVQVTKDSAGTIALRPVLALTSTVTSLDIHPDAVLWATTASGQLVRANLAATATIESRFFKGGITSVAAGAKHAAIGYRSGAVDVLDQNLEAVGRLVFDSPILALARLSGTEWIVGTETLGLGLSGGRVARLKIADDGTLHLLGSALVEGAVVSLAVVGGDREVVAVTARGSIYRLVPEPNGSLTVSADYRVAGEPVNVATTESEALVLGSNREVWALDLLASSPAELVGVLASGDSAIARVKEQVYAGSLSGTVELATLSADGPESESLTEVVGSATSIVSSHSGIAVLADYRTLQRVDSQGVTSVSLTARAVALRDWPGGVAVVHGLGGVRLYQASQDDATSHIRVTGLTRDIVYGEDTAFVAAGSNGVHCIELSADQSQVASTHPVDGLATAVALVEPSLLLVGQLGGDIQVVDVAEVAQPHLVATIENTPSTVRFAPTSLGPVGLGQDGFAYLIGRREGRFVVLREFAASWDGRDIAMSPDGTGYIAAGSSGVEYIHAASGEVLDVAHGFGGPASSVSVWDERWALGLGTGGLIEWHTRSRCFLPALVQTESEGRRR